MAKNRELSQVGSLVTVNDSSAQVGIANSVGINTTAPTGTFALDVHGTANISGTLADAFQLNSVMIRISRRTSMICSYCFKSSI